MVWRPGGNYNQFVEPDKEGQCLVGRVRLSFTPTDWQQLRVLQLLMPDDTAAIAEAEESGHTAPSAAADITSSHERLSTVPEGAQESDPTEDSQSSVGSYLKHDDNSFQEALGQVSDLLEVPLPTEMQEAPHDELVIAYRSLV